MFKSLDHNRETWETHLSVESYCQTWKSLFLVHECCWTLRYKSFTWPTQTYNLNLRVLIVHTSHLLFIVRGAHVPGKGGVLLLYVILPRWGGWQVSVVRGAARYSYSLKLTRNVYHRSMSHLNPLHFSAMFCDVRCENNVKTQLIICWNIHFLFHL